MRSVPGPSDPKLSRPIDDAPLGAPLFLLNLKAFPNCLGPGALRMAESLARAGAAAGVAVAVAPSAPDIGRVAHAVDVAVVAQHVDDADAGQHTGSIVAESVEASGGRGSLVNHSEHPVDTETAQRIVERLRGSGLVPVLCARTVDEAAKLGRLRPAYLAIEPPELIGGTVAVSSARPELIAGAVDAVRRVAPDTRVLCGAGIHTRADVSRALELGSSGVLVASAVARATDPGAALADLLAGY